MSIPETTPQARAEELVDRLGLTPTGMRGSAQAQEIEQAIRAANAALIEHICQELCRYCFNSIPLCPCGRAHRLGAHHAWSDAGEHMHAFCEAARLRAIAQIEGGTA